MDMKEKCENCGNMVVKIVTDSFRDEAMLYTTDSLMNNLVDFEKKVESVLIDKFKRKVEIYISKKKHEKMPY
jgi:hypothetical protein